MRNKAFTFYLIGFVYVVTALGFAMWLARDAQ